MFVELTRRKAAVLLVIVAAATAVALSGRYHGPVATVRSEDGVAAQPPRSMTATSAAEHTADVIPARRRSDTSATPEPAAALSPAQVAELNEQRLAELIEASERRKSALAERLDREVVSVPADPNWNPQSTITAEIEGADPAARVISVQCSANLCRVEVWHTEGTAKAGFESKLHRLIETAPRSGVAEGTTGGSVFRGGVMFDSNNNKPDVTHLYVSRPGYNFGEPPPPPLPPDLELAVKARLAVAAAFGAASEPDTD